MTLWADERAHHRAAYLRALLVILLLSALAGAGVALLRRAPPPVECVGIGQDPPSEWTEAMRDLAGAR